MRARIIKYFSKHVNFNATIHFLAGLGVGIMLTFPVFGLHPIRWGLLFLALALAGHLYAAQAK